MPSEPPVSVGDTFESVYIEDTGDEGDGITRIDGFVVVVPDTEEGETVPIEITNVADNVAFAEVRT